MSTEPTTRDPALELLDRLRDEASQHEAALAKALDRVSAALDEMRAKVVQLPPDSVVVALTEAAASERDRANRFSNLLKSTEAELKSVRATREAQVELEQELHDARETAARAAEEQRAGFAASRDRLQHVIDAQSLELIELRRVLGKANHGAPAVRLPALDAGRPALSARERLAETLPFDAIDAALSATPPVADWPEAV